VANGAIAQQTFEAYAAYVLPQLHDILAHSNPRPFAGNLEGHEYGADEHMMTGDLLYPNPLYPNPLYPTINSVQHLYPPQPLYPTQQHLCPTHGAYPTPQPNLPPPPGLGFAPHPHYPMANAMYPYPPAIAPSPAPASSDKAGPRQKGKNKKGSKTPPKEKMGTLNTTLPRTSLLRPFKTHVYCHHHGWVTTNPQHYRQDTRQDQDQDKTRQDKTRDISTLLSPFPLLLSSRPLSCFVLSCLVLSCLVLSAIWTWWTPWRSLHGHGIPPI
jgi:hypothetical protein